MSSSELISGKPVHNSVSLALSSELAKAELIQPVLIRDRWFGKVILPKATFEGGDWLEVSAADISLEFGEIEPRLSRISHGPLDRLLDDLAINSDEAASWETALVKPSDAAIYNPFSQSANWLRIAITESGVYRITRPELANAGFSVSGIDPRSIRLFHGGGRPLPLSNFTERDSMAEMAITVVGEADGILDDNDIIVFYANGRDFNAVKPAPGFVRHPYSDRNVYYLTYAGNFDAQPKRMAILEGPTNAPDTLVRFKDFEHFEVDATLSNSLGDIFDYYNWYWALAGDGDFVFDLPQPAALSVNRFRVKTTRDGFNLRVNNFEVQRDSARAPFYYYSTDRFTFGRNTIRLDYTFNDGYTDNVFIQLERNLTLPASGELTFYSGPGGSTHAYKITGQFSSPTLLEVGDIYNQRQIAFTSSGSELVFAHQASIDEYAQFALVNAAALRTPFSIVSTQVDDIRAAANNADLIVLTHDNFYNSALEYAAYRRQHDNMEVRVVRISDVYAQFSGGRLDPVAIRDFLRHAFRNWSDNKPSYCLLVGDGVYDFRNNLLTGGVNYIPPYIAPDDESVSDDNYVYLDSLYDIDSDNSYPTDHGVDMVIARWPVKSTAEFQAVFDKMQRYEAGEDAGSWRNTISLIADDENHPNSPPETFHTRDTEILANDILPDTYDLDKVYGVSYPFGAASEKPAMREAIIRGINEGRLIVNYIGHGNQNLWADERVFRRTQDIPRLNNADRLPLIFNASCSIGFFDDPRSEGMAEDLLRYPSGGAVGTISATRLVYSVPNFAINREGLIQLLSDKEYTIAEALYIAKLLRQGGFGVGDNDRKYIYIGDPLTRLAKAPNRINFVRFEPDSLVALEVSELEGQIENRDGIKQTNFDGVATISVFDDARTRVFRFPPDSVAYSEYGPEIFRGKVRATGGEFTLKFVVPKDISYGGNEARISGYAASATSGAAGVIYPITIGSINKDVVDSVGPEIVILYAGNVPLTEGASVAAESELTIELSDSLGINLSGEIGHGIELTIDEDLEFNYELTDSFAYFADNYQSGSAKMKLPNIPAGEHTLKIKAWDSANNSSQKSIVFNISSLAELEIRDFLCYPNPVRQDCEFSYTLSDDAAEVRLKLFTLSGLEIWSQEGLPASRGYHQGIRWNGFDADGDRPANGVYLMQLSARPATAGDEGVDNNKATATGKMVVLK